MSCRDFICLHETRGGRVAGHYGVARRLGGAPAPAEGRPRLGRGPAAGARPAAQGARPSGAGALAPARHARDLARRRRRAPPRRGDPPATPRRGTAAQARGGEGDDGWSGDANRARGRRSRRPSLAIPKPCSRVRGSPSRRRCRRRQPPAYSTIWARPADCGGSSCGSARRAAEPRPRRTSGATSAPRWSAVGAAASTPTRRPRSRASSRRPRAAARGWSEPTSRPAQRSGGAREAKRRRPVTAGGRKNPARAGDRPSSPRLQRAHGESTPQARGGAEGRPVGPRGDAAAAGTIPGRERPARRRGVPGCQPNSAPS